MEAPAYYGPSPVRPRLTVVKDGPGTYSALPHDIMRDTRLSRDARLLYAILQGYWWQTGECWASHATLAAEMGCTVRSLRAYLDELIALDAIVERAAGSRRGKVYTPHPFRTDGPAMVVSNTSKTSDCIPSNTSESSDCQPSNRKILQVQSESFDISNTSKTSDSKKKTPEKKTPEEELPPPVVDAAGAVAAAAVPDQAAILRALSDGAREILDWHRQCHGRRSPAKLNPESARVLEAAVADLGVERLRESVQYMAGLIPAVPELSKAIRAAKTKRTKDEAGPSQPQPYRNGSAPRSSQPAPRPAPSSKPATVRGTY